MVGPALIIALIIIGGLFGVILFFPVFGDEPIVPNPFTPRVKTAKVVLTIDGSLFLNLGPTYFNDLDVIVDVDNSTWTVVSLLQAQITPQVVLFPESGDFTVWLIPVEIHPLLQDGLKRGPWIFNIDIPAGRLVHTFKEVQGVIGVPEGIWDVLITSDDWGFGPDRDNSVVARIRVVQSDAYPQTYVVIEDGIIPGIPGI